MRYAVDPRQKALFDPAETMFSPLAVKHMRQDWPGIFRHQILHLMPVGKLGERFHPTLGCPTKELYSMAGAIFRSFSTSPSKRRCIGISPAASGTTR